MLIHFLFLKSTLGVNKNFDTKKSFTSKQLFVLLIKMWCRIGTWKDTYHFSQFFLLVKLRVYYCRNRLLFSFEISYQVYRLQKKKITEENWRQKFHSNFGKFKSNNEVNHYQNSSTRAFLSNLMITLKENSHKRIVSVALKVLECFKYIARRKKCKNLRPLFLVSIREIR